MTHLFLQLHTDSISLFEEDGVAPKLIPERRELVETPLSERPQSQLGLAHRPRHWRAGQMICEHILAKRKSLIQRLFVSVRITFLFRLLFFLGRLQVPRVHLFLKSFQFALVVLKENIQIKTSVFRTGTLNGKTVSMLPLTSRCCSSRLLASSLSLRY